MMFCTIRAEISRTGLLTAHNLIPVPWLAATLMLVLTTSAIAQLPVQTLARPPAPVIAAGDVEPNAAVLWVQSERVGTVVVELATPNDSDEMPRRFERQVDSDSDFTAKIRVQGLIPGSQQRWRAALIAAPEPALGELQSDAALAMTEQTLISAPGSTLSNQASALASHRISAAGGETHSTRAQAQSEQEDEIIGEWAIGSFRTPPDAYVATAIRFIWGGDLGGQNVCRDSEQGFEIFAAIDALAPDLFVAAGDMIYADGLCDASGRYGNPQIPASFGKATDLDGFRAHWRYSRADPGLRRVLAETAYFPTWDDHEVVNDFGPLHDTRDRPPYRAGEHLLPLGLTAMLEQNPIGEDPRTPKRLYRAVRWGQHLELLLLDTRQYRDANSAPDLPQRPKTMLGREQLTWLQQRLTHSDATWLAIVSSVPLAIPTGWPPEAGRDGWASLDGEGGFTRELLAILEHAAANGRNNLVFISADAHHAAAFRYRPFPQRPDFVVHEFISGPLSAGIEGSTEFALNSELVTERLFLHAPESRDAVVYYADARHWFTFGEIAIEETGELTASLRGIDGKALYTLRLTPPSATRLAMPAPDMILGLNCKHRSSLPRAF